MWLVTWHPNRNLRVKTQIPFLILEFFRNEPKMILKIKNCQPYLVFSNPKFLQGRIPYDQLPRDCFTQRNILKTDVRYLNKLIIVFKTFKTF